jgi:hypothetical protein
MNEFLAVTIDPGNKAPPISDFIARFTDPPNSSFFQLGDRLARARYVNPSYSIVALRSIISLSPIHPEISEFTDDLLNPVNSFRWFFLIHSLASRTISQDATLEAG